MATWKIPVSWEMSGFVEVEAPSLKEAISIAETNDLALPNGCYVDASWKVDAEDEDFVREFYNNNQKDENVCTNDLSPFDCNMYKPVTTKEQFESARQCLIENGIDSDEANTVLQALCCILCNTETGQYFKEE